MAKALPLTVTVEGLPNLFGKLGFMGDWAKKPIGKDNATLIRESFNAHAMRQWDSRGQHMGTRWRKLSPAYAKRKAKTHPGKPLMIRSTNLVKSLADKRNPRAIFRHNGKSLTLGSRVPYAIYHQKGTARLPRRPLFVVTKKIAHEWAEILSADLEAKIK